MATWTRPEDPTEVPDPAAAAPEPDPACTAALGAGEELEDQGAAATEGDTIAEPKSDSTIH